jgi:asparagine synthase (glutamine-hydrolysing)
LSKKQNGEQHDLSFSAFQFRKDNDFSLSAFQLQQLRKDDFRVSVFQLQHLRKDDFSLSAFQLFSVLDAMCGIAAIFNYGANADYVSREELLTIRDHMATRGPDGVGEWISADRRVGLGHRRLSIIDLSPTGAQPMFNEDKSLAIIFNGEIYNYRELRSQLEAKGRRFFSQSDTEVLLHLYAEGGSEMVNALRGMYAFIIWDATKRSLFLARDPFGIKPLYYADDGKTVRVASQVKALLAGGRVDTSVDPAGHVGFFLWGAVPDPFTLYRGISALPAGHTLTISENGDRQLRAFCSIPEILGDAERNALSSTSPPQTRRGEGEESIREILHAALHDSAEHHLVADVPVGVFLSAGLDSSTITALVSETHSDVRTVTLGFDEYRGSKNDETHYADVTARSYKTNHEIVWVTRDDFAEERENLFRAMDRPSIDGVNTYFVSLAAKKTGLKVALSGLGGDELFGGYPSFRDVPRLVRLTKYLPALRRLGGPIRAVSSKLLRKFTSPKYAGIFEYGSSYPAAYLLRRSLFMPWELPAFLDPDLVRDGWERLNTLGQLAGLCDSLDSARLKVSAMELCWYMRHQLLRDSDWAGMAHSVEIRVPFIDVDLLKNLAPMLAQRRPLTKRDVARSLRSKLPASILSRPKTGFSIPVREWLMEISERQDTRHTSHVTRHQPDRGLRGWAKEVYSRFPGAALISASQRFSVSGFQKSQVRGQRSAPSSELLAPNSQSNSKLPSGKRILVFRIGQLGDTIVALPAMWTVRRHFSNAHLALLCDRHPGKRYVLGSDLLEGTHIFDEVLSYPVSDLGFILKPGRMANLLAAIRRRKFDTLVYLAPSNRTIEQVERDRWFFSLAGIKHFIGMEGFPHLAAKIPGQPLAGTNSETDLLLRRLAVSGLPVKFNGGKVDRVVPNAMDLGLGQSEEAQVAAWLSRLGPDGGRPWVAIGPGSKMPAKRWPPERFKQIVSSLVDEFDIWPVVFGGQEDKALGDQLLNHWKRGYNAAGALGLRPAAAALKRCTLFLGNDTGTMHMAAAVGVPCVAVFSSRERPGMWFPHGDGHRVFRSEIDCEGCGLVECIERQNECLKRISADQVLSACRELLVRGSRKAEWSRPGTLRHGRLSREVAVKETGGE